MLSLMLPTIVSRGNLFIEELRKLEARIEKALLIEDLNNFYFLLGKQYQNRKQYSLLSTNYLKYDIK